MATDVRDHANPPKHHRVGRLVSFSDGVVAIGITLLILPLAAIDLPTTGEAGSEARTNPLGYVWQNNQGLIVSFVISWIVILVFWLAHHRIFERIQAINPTIMLWNSIWLFAIVVLPFPTNLLGQFPSDGEGIKQIAALYLVTLMILSLAMSMVVYEIRKDPTLVKEEERWREPNPTLWSLFDTPVFIAVLTVLAFAIGQYAIWGLFLLWPLASITSQIEKFVLARRAELATADTERKSPDSDSGSDQQ